MSRLHARIFRQAELLVKFPATGLIFVDDFVRILRDGKRRFSGDDYHPVAVGHNDVAGHHEDAATNNRPINRLDFIPSGTNSPARLLEIERYLLSDDFVRIASSRARDHTHAASEFPGENIV